MVAVSSMDNKIVAVGDEARQMLGRTPEMIEVIRPMRDGVIADYMVTEAMLRYFIPKCAGGSPLQPGIMISVPVGVTSVESRAVHDAAIQAGGRDGLSLPEPLAAALGAGLPIDTPSGNMVVDIGGGTSEAAVISLNGIVVISSVRVGGNKIDDAIASYVRRKYNLMIGDRTAEEIKLSVGSALPVEEEMVIEVRGRDQIAGLPRTIELRSSEVTEAMAEPLATIVGTVRSVLERTPPELASDVIDRGMVLAGGGAMLRGMERLLAQETRVPCLVAENAIACVALGAGKALENYDILKRTMPQW